jgi:hypothetical protein
VTKICTTDAEADEDTAGRAAEPAGAAAAAPSGANGATPAGAAGGESDIAGRWRIKRMST